jgi:hypothetical protein
MAVAAIAIVTMVPGAHGQASDDTGVRWLTLKRWNAYAEMDFEDESDSQKVGKTSYDSERLYIAPTLGLNMSGSVYHPNLLSFDLKGQGGYIEQDLTSTYGGQRVSTHQTSFLQGYDIALNFLRSRPYAFTFTADKSHTFQQLDAFNQVTVDSQSYGGNIGYSSGPVPVNLSLIHSEVNETGAFYNSTYHQDNLQFSAQNSRDHGNTTFNLTAGQYSQQVTGGFNESQAYVNGSLNDTERFGKDNRATLTSTSFYNEESSAGSDSRNVTDQESLTVKHSEKLDSFYNYNFNDAAYSGAEAMTHNGMMGMRYQLFESLTSQFDVHGATEKISEPGGSSLDVYGVGNSENYTKHLSTWGVLSLGNSARYDIQHENNSGQITPIFNESHVLSTGTPTFLNQPLVIAVTRVTDATGAHVYIQGLDYIVTQFSSLVVIERVPTSINLPNNSTVLVDYTVQSQPTGSIYTLSDQFSFRLDLWNGLMAVYSTMGWVENSSKEPFILENYFNTQSGVDFKWRWLRLGGAYETDDSNLIAYDDYSLYQAATFQPTARETIDLDARERWSYYFSQALAITDYTFTTRFSEHFSPKCDFSVEAGVLSERGGLLNQTLWTAGARARYMVGKIALALNYQFNQQTTPGTTVLRNFGSFTVRRDF